MIRHIVLVRFRADVPDAIRTGLIAELASLRDHLRGMLAFAAIRNVSSELAVIHGFHDGFVVDFADLDARDAYLVDPAHRAIGGRLVAACEGGTEGIVVFDHAL